MASEIATYERIDRYLNGEMNAEERTAFEQECSQNQALMDALRLQTSARFVSWKYAKTQQKNLYSETPTEGKVRSFRSPYLIASVAAVILLLVISAIFLFQPKQVAMQDLYAEHFLQSTERPLRNLRDLSSDSTAFGKAIEAFEANEYESAAAQFQSLATQPGFSYPKQAWLYLGLSNLYLQQAPEALKAFENIQPDSEVLWLEAKWYSAMAALSMEDKVLARKNLEAFLERSRNVNRKEKAEEILQAL